MSSDEGRTPIDERIEELRKDNKNNQEITLILYNEGYQTSSIMKQGLSLRPLKGIRNRPEPVVRPEEGGVKEEPVEEPINLEEPKITIDERIRELEEQGMTKKEMAPIIYDEGYPTTEMMERGIPLRSIKSKTKKVRGKGLGEDDLLASITGTAGGKGWLEEMKTMIKRQVNRSRELTEVFSDIGLGIILASLSKSGMNMEEFQMIALKREGLRAALVRAGETAFKALEYYESDLVSRVEEERDEARAYASYLERSVKELVEKVDPRVRMERMIHTYLLSGNVEPVALNSMLDRWIGMEMGEVRMELVV